MLYSMYNEYFFNLGGGKLYENVVPKQCLNKSETIY